ncbi:MAG: N-6 DNA methylase [Candidatus Lokiarchaeota archaeon]|nr:N-6 DNA methylase [Candidatus Lokiarchaeota archaeon]
MSSLYQQFNSRFNTAIFAPSPVDSLELSDEVYESVIKRLYKYNFDKIDADVLGNVYEEYLGHILKEKEGGYTLTENYLNKQKHGIYYTKSYIVKYIITKTVLNKIRNIESQESLKDLKLIDISCGSGTFLVESFNVLENRYSKVRESEDNSSNTGTLDSWLAPRFNWKDILTNNIFGIDIDLFATELASVNLALRSITKTEKLPLILDENIFCKNSLFYNYDSILGESEGFDFVVGNPPYVLGDNLEEEEKAKLSLNYSEVYQAEADYCFYFIKKGIDLLKEGGRLGFIVARYFLKAKYGKNLRDYITKNCKILEIIDFGNIDVFEGIGSRCCIFIIEKTSEIPDSHNIQVINVTSRKIKVTKERIFIEILNLENALQRGLEGKTPNLEGFFKNQSELTPEPWILTMPKKEDIYNKCKNNFASLKELVFRIGQGGICGLERIFRVSGNFFNSRSLEIEVWKPDVKTKDIRAYSIGEIEDYIFYGDYIDDFSEFDRFPNTKKYLLENLAELAFGRLDFQVDNRLTRKENNLIKKIGQKSYDKDYMNIAEFESEIKKIHKRRKNEDLEDYENRINEKKEKFRDIDIFNIVNDEIHLDVDSIDFHNYWNWWKWTSPRNIDLFKNTKILTPYISDKNNFMIDYDNRFSVSAAVIGVAYPLNEENPDFNFLLGLLNSRLYTFLHQIRAKPLDYRFEYFVEALEELPFPIEIDSSKKNQISTHVKNLLDLMKQRKIIEARFIQVLLNNNALEKKIRFEKIWNNLTRVGINRNRITPGDPIFESIALKIELRNLEFDLKYFSIEEQEWVSCLKFKGEEEGLDYLEILYLLLDIFLKENQIASRTSWRKGQLFSEILLKNIRLYSPKNLSRLNYLCKFPDMMEELKVSVGSDYRDLSSIDNEILELEQKINDIVYDIFELNSDERKLIEDDINFDIPYLP